MAAPDVARTALVTGAARGIGQATVAALLERGWHVVAGVRDVDAARELLPRDERLLIVPMDVTDHAQVAEAVGRAQAFAGGALDLVVNNAGYALVGAVEDVAIDEVRALFETNTLGALAVTQAVLPAMREARQGTVVFVSTIGATLPTPLLGAYRASKAALNAFADVLALEGRAFGIRVGRVEPGMVATDFSLATRRSGSVTDPAGPYAPLAVGLRDGMGRWRDRFESTAEAVAGDIMSIVEDRDAPRVILVGEDAKELHGSDEDDILRFLGMEWPRR